ncbi:MAG: 1-deoxy-D-xylulose-5-phosphate synthase [Muribaculaceae bacterium]|nr:1-deoxy-D-xylulose-5-phosphate synthase [Muribaculaceae bacterium]
MEKQEDKSVIQQQETGVHGFPLLETIQSPADLRRLPVERLPELCTEIRRFLVKELAANPGHFASSMGAVELTVALHYVFDTPYDRLVWDVGHQAYGHKLLTGRRDKFHTNRTFGGISGFPSPEESEYDTFTAGHASNSISAALGFAIASHLKKEDPERHVVAVVGDASISGGLAFEGINNVANNPNNLLIVLNDNDMSIDHNVGALNSYLTHIHTSKSYNAFRFATYKAMKKLGLVNDRRRGIITRFSNSLKAVISNEQNIFEGLNIRYFGPFDGHDVIRLVKVLNDIKNMTGPRILHLRTVKGKGYQPAEQDPACWHAPGKFDPETGQRHVDSNKLKYQDVFGQELLKLAEQNEDVVAITAAMPTGTSVSTMLDKLPERVFDVGISEGHAVTFAGGLAKEGMRPVVAIYSSFLQRGYDHIIHDVAIQKLPVIFAIDRAGLVGEDGVTHHGLFDIAYMRSVPGMIIAAPRDNEYLRSLMLTAYHYKEGPFAIRYPRGASKLPDTETPGKVLPIGKGEKLHDGDRIALLALGPMVEIALSAADKLAEEGISASVYDMIYAKPLDTDILSELTSRNIPIVTLEDGTIVGGLGSAVDDYVTGVETTSKVHKIGVKDNFVTHGSIAQLQQLCGMDVDSVVKTVRDIIRDSKANSSVE